MKKRGFRSPDMADALGLTFAKPVRKPRPPARNSGASLSWMG
jgi:hypothetical protein